MGEFYAGKCDVRSACSHCPDDFADARSVVDLHGFGEGFLILWVGGTGCCVEFLEPDWACWKGNWFVFCDRCVVEPSVDILFTDFVDVGVAVYFDVVPCLCDIDAVEHVNEALAFEGNAEVVINYVKECVCCVFVLARDGKVVYLTHEEDALVVDGTGIETWLVDGRCESYVAEDGVCVFFP